MNDILFLSLVQDINSLESLILKIRDVHKDSSSTINSWRQPTKNFLDILNFKVDEEQPTDLQYTTILEVLIDRLYILLNQYLDYTTTAIVRCSLKHISGRPQKISLGALNSNLWEQIKSICEVDRTHKHKGIVSNKDKCNIILERGNSETQTEQVNSSQCNSCFVAVNCIKSIARQMELLLPDSFTEKNRKQLEPNIFELTQFGCMNSIITAILADVQMLAENIKKSKTDCKEELTRNSILQNEVENKSKSITELQLELSKMENKIEKLSAGIENYKSELHSRSESENTYKCLLKALPQELQVAKDKINSLQSELETLQYSDTVLKLQVENLQKQQGLIIVERDMWKLQYTSSHEKNNSLKLQNEDFDKEIGALTDCVQRTEESLKSLNLLMDINVTKMDEKLNNHNILMNKLQGIVEKKVMQEQEMLKLKKFESQTSVATTIDDQAKYKKHENNLTIMKGNPIEDMAKQIELNNSNMKKLQAQNDTLILTINKLQAIQVKKRMSIF